MRVGFTGTQFGMSKKQKEEFVLNLQKLNPTEFHHGDCLGADAEAHDIVREFFPECLIVLHPPTATVKRAYKQADMENMPEPYLNRNRNIVRDTDVLIAAPKSDEEELRSGTWATIRYGRKSQEFGHYPVIILPR